MIPRRLVFEQLESKLSPSSFLLVMASIPESEQAALEQWLVDRPDSEELWQRGGDSLQLLQFVEQHTRSAGVAAGTCGTPSQEQCEAADDWLRLDAADVRELVVTESLNLGPFAS